MGRSLRRVQRGEVLAPARATTLADTLAPGLAFRPRVCAGQNDIWLKSQTASLQVT